MDYHWTKWWGMSIKEGGYQGNPWLPFFPLIFHFSSCHNFAHIYAMVLIYIPTFSPFDMLSNGMFCLAIHA